MNIPQPLSPVHGVMPRYGDGEVHQAASILGIADLSIRPRAGAKGPGTADWLAGFGLPIPSMPNNWCELPNGGLIARMGLTEYMVEGNQELAEKIMGANRVAGVYPVLRQDASFALCGSRVNELFLQTCNVDFRILDAEPSKLVLTSMAGVSVMVLATQTGPAACYRLWCDGTYGIYLWETLAGITQELGGCIGPDALQ
ncbi:MAG: methylglutamate dehydrogenase [Gallionella sp.]